MIAARGGPGLGLRSPHIGATGIFPWKIFDWHLGEEDLPPLSAFYVFFFLALLAQTAVCARSARIYIPGTNFGTKSRKRPSQRHIPFVPTVVPWHNPGTNFGLRTISPLSANGV